MVTLIWAVSKSDRFYFTFQVHYLFSYLCVHTIRAYTARADLRGWTLPSKYMVGRYVAVLFVSIASILQLDGLLIALQVSAQLSTWTHFFFLFIGALIFVFFFVVLVEQILDFQYLYIRCIVVLTVNFVVWVFDSSVIKTLSFECDFTNNRFGYINKINSD